MESLARKIAQQALEEKDEEQAVRKFRIAQMVLQELTRANARAGQLQRGIAALESALTEQCVTVSGDSSDRANNLPAHWDEGFEPRQIQYIRSLGEATANANKGSVFDVLAQSLQSLEKRYAVLYASAMAIDTSRAELPVPDEIMQACRDRVGCYCCGLGCHTCEFCQPYIHREGTLRTLAREIEDEIDV